MDKHQRHLTEAKVRSLKLPDQRLTARTFDPQAAELRIRAVPLKRVTALDTLETGRAA